MSANLKPISPLHQRMIEDMRLRKFSEKTQSGHIRAVRGFCAFLGRSPDTATAEDLRRYQLHLANSGVVRPSLNPAVTALRFFCEVTLGHAELTAKTGHARAERTLPVILSVEEVTRQLDSAPGLKYQAALSVAYGAGLRTAEVVALKVGDNNSERLAIRVEQGKGRRDHYAMLSPTLGARCYPADGCSRGRTRSLRCPPASSIAPATARRRTPGSPSASRCIP